MLINCVIIVTFFLYSTLFMKKSSREEFKEVHRKVTNTVFYWKKKTKIKTTLNVIVRKGQNKEGHDCV